MQSRAHDHEHLMIIYYDVLMVDDESLLNQRQSERRRRLKNLITCQQGYAEIVQHQVVACRKRTAASELREIFAKCITNRQEGVVLKPDTPYFDFSTKQKPYACCSIKLKKEYIQGWGDVGDFAVIGASYDAAQAKAYKIPNLKWTQFYVGCLQNRTQAAAKSELPRFSVVNIVEINETLMKTFLTHCSPETVPLDAQEVFELELHGVARTKPPAVIFLDPVIFDIRCFSFDKEPNSADWSMRFPMVSKIHFDRSYIDAITYEELQEAAKMATETPEQEDSQELRDWIRALEKADPRGIAVDAVSQHTTSSESTEASSAAGSREHESERNEVIEQEPRAIEPALACSGHARGLPSLPTPASSALGQEPVTSSSTEATSAESERSKTKRPCESDDSGSSKRHRRRSIDVESSSTHEVEQDVARPPAPAREPLGQIDRNISTTERGWKNISTSTPSMSSIDTSRTSNIGAVERSPTQSRQSNNENTNGLLSDHQPHSTMPPAGEQPRQDMSSSLSLDDSPTSTCPYAGDRCTFANKSILLSPCIAGYAWVTETLLEEKHGITRYITDPVEWTKKEGGKRKRPAARARKICLVEIRREEATEAFLAKIKETNLQRKNGQRELVAVYDWRILEKVTELESHGRGPDGSSYDPWRQHYYGIV